APRPLHGVEGGDRGADQGARARGVPPGGPGERGGSRPDRHPHPHAGGAQPRVRGAIADAAAGNPRRDRGHRGVLVLGRGELVRGPGALAQRRGGDVMPPTIVAGPDPGAAAAVAHGIAPGTEIVLVGPGAGAHDVPAVEADLRRPESTAAAFRRVVDTWGSPEAVVVVPPSIVPRPFHEVDPELWESTLDGALTAAMHVCRFAAPALVRAGAGAASGAVHLLARALAVELGPFGVRVNAVSAPAGDVEAAVPAVRLLLSSDAAYVTCEVVGATASRARAAGPAGGPGDGVALVTGAGRGIGAAVAERLAREGLPVAVNGLEPGETERTVARIVDSGGVAAPFPADVADPRAVDEMIGSVEDWRGPVRVLVNNAGILQ